jgi:hypothetical protein
MPKISCIHKISRDNPHERITHVGGLNADGTRWRMTQPDAIRWVELPANERFWVERSGLRVDVVVKTSRFGHKYLTTEADGESQNNLLALPECPS